MKRLLLVIREQEVAASDILRQPDTYPAEFLWGYRTLCQVLGQDRVQVIYSRLKGKGSNAIIKLYHALMTKLLEDMRISFELAFRLWRVRKATEAIFVTANNSIITVLSLKLLGCSFRVYPLLLGWPEFKFSKMSHIMRNMWVSILNRADSVLVLGVQEGEELRRLGINNVRFLSFGVDTEFWRPRAGKPSDYVFSIGADPNRDFDTLLSANLEMPIILCAPPERVRGLKIPQNVTLVQGKYTDVRRWLQHARIVVIPIKDTVRPSGQGSVLQAMASGKTVVTTLVKGGWTNKLRHNDNCILIPPNDPKALREAVCLAYNDLELLSIIGRNARKLVLDYFSVAHFAKSLISITGIHTINTLCSQIGERPDR